MYSPQQKLYLGPKDYKFPSNSNMVSKVKFKKKSILFFQIGVKRKSCFSSAPADVDDANFLHNNLSL